MKKLKIQSFFSSVLAILGLSEFHQENGKRVLTDEEVSKLKSYSFNDSFITALQQALNEPEGGGEDGTAEMAVISTMLGQVTSQLEAANAEIARLREAASTDKNANTAALEASAAKIQDLVSKVQALSSLPEPDVAGNPVSPSASWNINDEAQLGGMSGEFFALDRPYNLRAKASLLAAEGKMITVNAASRADFKTLQDDLGAFYRTPWRDRLQSFLTLLPTITRIFPLESGHQDLETLVSLFLGEFSQADTSGESDFDKVAKGSYDFGTETLRMYEVMFVHRFRSLKILEKTWIGYLNREGSNPVKLSFIEFLLAETAKKLHNERENRWVNGIRRNPDPNVPGKALEAADGIYEYLRKRIEGHIDFTPNGGMSGKTVYQIRPFDLLEITPGNIGEVFYLGTQMIPAQIRDTNSLVLYIPAYMLAWYNRYNEEKYGKNTDYKGKEPYVHEFPNVRIETVPNADNHRRIFWTLAGNIKTYEHVSGEMIKFEIEQEDWSLKVWSNWKESVQAEAVGRKFLSKDEVTGTDQMIWTNNEDIPANVFTDTPSGENPDVSVYGSVSVYSVKVTDVENAVVGSKIVLRAGDDGVRVSNGGKFSLTADWQPRKGDTLTLIAISGAGGVDFLEIGRSSGVPSGALMLAEGASPSVMGGDKFVVPAVGESVELTGLADAIPGKVYTIYGNGSSDACCSLSPGGKFSVKESVALTTGTAVQVVLAADGKFHVVSQC